MVLVHLLPTVGGVRPLASSGSTPSRSAGSSTRRGPGSRTTAAILFDATNPLRTGFFGAVQNTAVYTFWTVGLTLVGGLAVALLLNRADARAAARRAR